MKLPITLVFIGSFFYISYINIKEMSYLLTFLLVMSILFLCKETFEVVKWFIKKDEEYKQSWVKTLLAFASISYIITIIIFGV